MLDFIDIKYSNLLSGSLDRFSIKNTNPMRINFRCPICNDSNKNRSKARGWLLEKSEGKNGYLYYCFNCHVSMPFWKFLKEQNHMLYEDYISEKFLTNKKPPSKEFDLGNHKKTLVTKIEKKDDTHLSKIKKMSELSDSHPAKLYLLDRKLPKNKIEELYYAPKFKQWVNTIIENKFPNIKKDEPRLIIPFMDENGIMFGFSARSFDPKSSLRYITIMIDDRQYKFYGLDKVDYSKQYFVFEGPIDSMFFDNSMAMAGADADVSVLKNLENCIVVYDNEPRNRDIHKKMKQVMKKGIKVCIWPSNIEQKDVNDMILKGGFSSDNIKKIIVENAITGMLGEIKFNEWKKSL